jgi:hypothetical protein
MVKRSACFIVLVTIWVGAVSIPGAYGETSAAIDTPGKGKASISEEKMLTDPFDRWERVWQEGRYDLISVCIGPSYIRHDEVIGR